MRIMLMQNLGGQIRFIMGDLQVAYIGVVLFFIGWLNARLKSTFHKFLKVSEASFNSWGRAASEQRSLVA